MTDAAVPSAEECTQWEVRRKMYNMVMAQFDVGTLEAMGKEGILYTVRNPKQALAIAASMAKRATKQCHTLIKPEYLGRDFPSQPTSTA